MLEVYTIGRVGVGVVVLSGLKLMCILENQPSDQSC